MCKDSLKKKKITWMKTLFWLLLFVERYRPRKGKPDVRYLVRLWSTFIPPPVEIFFSFSRGFTSSDLCLPKSTVTIWARLILRPLLGVKAMEASGRGGDEERRRNPPTPLRPERPPGRRPSAAEGRLDVV